MTTRKLNDFLDTGFSDGEDSDRGYDSEAAEETKGRQSSSKRRKVSSDDEDDASESEGQDSAGGARKTVKLSTTKSKKAKTADARFNLTEDMEDGQDEDEDDDDDEEQDQESTTRKSLKKEDLKKSALKSASAARKTGVVYLSSLPPYLKPAALKTMLIARGFEPITRIFLTPSSKPSPGSTLQSVQKSNKRRTFTDGWIEFGSKKTAKVCAATLNAEIIGGRKGSWYHDDIWNMKYLRGFKWDDLMEQMQRERSEREARSRIEDERAKKGDREFALSLEKGREREKIQATRDEKEKKRVEKSGGADDGAGAVAVEVKKSKSKAKIEKGPSKQQPQLVRTFRQVEGKGTTKKKDGQGSVNTDTKRVLSKIF